jgi:CubicO group peptidase (beta-lactamase class C family)
MQITAAIALTLSLQQPLPSDSVARALLTQRVSAFADSGKHGSGIVVGLLDASGTRRIVAVGVDGSLVFEIGSITKAFTASLLADMAARGDVRLDDPVAKYLPSSAHVPSRNGKQITLVDLATQSSGLPRLPTNLAPRNPANPYADYSVEQLYAFLSGYELPRDVGATYEYSNLGMGLLGHALALKAGTSYENLVNRLLLTPLGMRETAITLSPALRARLAPGHDGEGNVVPNWDLPTLAGAGALRSTALDMLMYLAANLDTTAKPLARAMRETHTPRRDAGGTCKSAFAWHILSRPSGTSFGTTGEPAVIDPTWFDPVRRVGVVLLSMSAMRASMTSAFTSWMRPFRCKRLRGAARKSPSIRWWSLDTWGTTSWRRHWITVTREGAQLFVQATAQSSPDLCRVGLHLLSEGGRCPITFRADGLVLHQNGQHLPAARFNSLGLRPELHAPVPRPSVR